MSVRAKFRVTGKEALARDLGGGNSQIYGYVINMTPVIAGGPENDSFYNLTPGGSACLATVNPAAADQFAVGQEYYVDFATPEDVKRVEAQRLADAQELVDLRKKAADAALAAVVANPDLIS